MEAYSHGAVENHLGVPNVAFSIAALVKLFLVTSCHIPSARRSALPDVAARALASLRGWRVATS